MTVRASAPGEGCTTCGSTDTATVDGVSGRRCGQHPPGYSRAHALGLVDRGDVRGATAHLRAALAFRAHLLRGPIR